MVKRQKSIRILIVDDDQEVIKELKSLLRQHLHYAVDAAYNGKEAFDLMNVLPDAYSLVLIEILVPKLNGIEVCEMMAHNPLLRHIPVMLMSNLPLRSSEFQRSLLRYNEFSVVRNVIEKPINEYELLEKIGIVIKSDERRHAHVV